MPLGFVYVSIKLCEPSVLEKQFLCKMHEEYLFNVLTENQPNDLVNPVHFFKILLATQSLIDYILQAILDTKLKRMCVAEKLDVKLEFSSASKSEMCSVLKTPSKERSVRGLFTDLCVLPGKTTRQPGSGDVGI